MKVCGDVYMYLPSDSRQSSLGVPDYGLWRAKYDVEECKNAMLPFCSPWCECGRQQGTGEVKGKSLHG